MRRALGRLSVLGLLCAALPAAAAPAVPTPPPPPAVRAVTQNLYGTTVTDRYRYFEDMSRPDVQAYFRRQNTYTRAMLARLDPARTRLLASHPSFTCVESAADAAMPPKLVP